MNRRKFFTQFANGSSCSVDGSLGAKYYTNAVFRTHEGKEVRFYEDLIKGKHVVVNFMYTKCDGTCSTITSNLVRVQKALQQRVGHDIFMYSISIKPEEDDPATLKEYARSHGVKPGWTFLTGTPYDTTTVRVRLTGMDHPGIDLDTTQHTGMVRVINDPLNRWFGCSALAGTQTIAQVIRWCDPIKPLEVRMKENAIIQSKIDRMTVLPTWLDSLGEA